MKNFKLFFAFVASSAVAIASEQAPAKTNDTYYTKAVNAVSSSYNAVTSSITAVNEKVLELEVSLTPACVTSAVNSSVNFVAHNQVNLLVVAAALGYAAYTMYANNNDTVAKGTFKN